MHEASIATALLDQLAQLCHAHGRDAISCVTLEVGDQSGVDPDSLRFAFEALAPTTCAAQADLNINTIATQLTCQACERSSQPDTPFAACPHCGSTNVTLRAGRELLIQSIDFPTANQRN